ncbi:hypothetical protein DCAR_0101437 [Daucus carota subsp. sativus]|uniref:Uncharacterized protein n=1 Tax=Daucus carota subsp. sativus TaxID=79200 RepID=A0A166GDD4_DAUCS|nr:PREDICTED: pollen-specific leucine-rich repeat extensin-like protein 2 [Daucus carota subsp. sativus]WOG82274.1 hypothetical protein DCAR_0101437 [Daucus carota subsp. sativus]
MDSGNSGSTQSSGGEEDYDPRTAANSPFNPIYNHLSPPPPTMYDPHTNTSNFFNPPPQLQLQQLTNPYLAPQSQTLSFPPHHFKQNQPTLVLPASSSQPSTRKIDQHKLTQVTRNPKKRSRASRRAPTTILTTDTSNFRAMVQEFTGIPAPPFSQSSTFPRSRLDLFSPPSSIRSSINITQTPSYNTRSPLIFPSTSELGFLKHQQLQNPNHSNFLQSSSSTSSIFTSKQGHDFSLLIPSQSNLRVGALEEFGFSYGQMNTAQVSGLPDLISPENGNNYVRNSTNGKQNINYSATNFHDGKRATDNVSSSATRGMSEGIMEPWI